MGVFGNILRGAIGQAGGQLVGGDQGRQVGGTIGGALGGLLPFKKAEESKPQRGNQFLLWFMVVSTFCQWV